MLSNLNIEKILELLIMCVFALWIIRVLILPLIKIPMAGWLLARQIKFIDASNTLTQDEKKDLKHEAVMRYVKA